MVARPEETGDAGRLAKDVAASLFERWRRWLSAGVARARDVRPPRLAVSRRASLTAAGLVALATGTILSLALARPLGVPPVEAAIAAAWTLAWALARLAILRAASPRLSTPDVAVAWATGLLPAAIAFADVMRLVALAASAWLTAVALRSAGASRREALRAVGWAFGAEAAALLARWIGGAALLYALVR